METIWDTQKPGILIEDKYGQDFLDKTKKALNDINSGVIGAELLKILSLRNQGIGTSAGKKVVIHKGDEGDGTLTTSARPTGSGTMERKSARVGHKIRLPGSGKGSNVLYNPDIEAYYTKTVGITTPAYIALAHELIHAYHVISGDVIKEYAWNNGTSSSSSGAILEEARTVGCGTYEKIHFSENAIRKEHGLPLRKFYSTEGDCDDVSINKAIRTNQLPFGLPIGHKDWMTKTERTGQWRSIDLKAVDSALAKYCTSSNYENLQNLKRIFKHWYEKNPQERTKRNTDNCIEKLRGFILSK